MILRSVGSLSSSTTIGLVFQLHSVRKAIVDWWLTGVVSEKHGIRDVAKRCFSLACWLWTMLKPFRHDRFAICRTFSVTLDVHAGGYCNFVSS